MDLVLKVYLVVVISIFIVGIISFIPHHSIHPLGLNSTNINETTCKYTWLGGIDYDSFVRDITVDNVSVGHPPKGTVIHEGKCDAVVRMYMIDVKTYVQLYPTAGRP
jgi:hypothetical protein